MERERKTENESADAPSVLHIYIPGTPRILGVYHIPGTYIYTVRMLLCYETTTNNSSIGRRTKNSYLVPGMPVRNSSEAHLFGDAKKSGYINHAQQRAFTKSYTIEYAQG